MAIVLTAYPSSLEVTRGEHVLEGGIRNYDVEFRFPRNDTTWQGMALVGVFKSDLGEWAAFLDMETHTCKIPWEALDEGSAGSSLTIGLYGVKEDDNSVIVRSTVWTPMPFRILPGPDAEPAQEPTLSLFQQIMSAVSSVVQRINIIQTIEKTVFNLANQVTKMHQETEENTEAARESASEAAASSQSARESAATATEAAEIASESKLITLSAAREAVQAASRAEAAAANADADLQKAQELLEDAQDAAERAEELLQTGEDAEKYAAEAKSWAVGETGTREGEDTDNSKYYASQAALSLEEIQGIVSEYKLCGGTVHVLDVTIPAGGWSASELEEYPYTIDVVVEESDADYFPELALDHDSLDIAAEAGLCATIEALDGVVRFWATELPDGDMTGVLALTRAGEGHGNVNIATDEEVKDTIEEVFGSEVEIPDGSGSGTTSANIATDEEVKEVIAEVFGEEISVEGGSGSSGIGYEVATEEEVAETIEDIFGE